MPHPKPFSYRSKLFFLFLIWWLVWAYQPLFFSDWVLENILTVSALIVFVLTRNSFRFSNLSYTLIFVFMLFHTVGAHYTYAEVPYEKWSAALGFSINSALGLTRNHFDRLVHFLFGFLLAYPVREVFVRIVQARGAWGYYLPLDVVMSISMLYELIEWFVAVIVGGDLGMAYLGTQGDIWDAHKDMALASLGAALTMTVVALVNMRYQRDFAREFAESVKVKESTPLGEVRLRGMKRKPKIDKRQN